MNVRSTWARWVCAQCGWAPTVWARATAQEIRIQVEIHNKEKHKKEG